MEHSSGVQGKVITFMAFPNVLVSLQEAAGDCLTKPFEIKIIITDEYE
ncbi:MAG: hypothetical protein QM768_09835 [Agriterribacter sp.]